jgi:hypothetical protein
MASPDADAGPTPRTAKVEINITAKRVMLTALTPNYNN